MYKTKVLVIGPSQSGKTTISNFLSDATETSGGEYHPTQGCRILEFEVNGIRLGKQAVNTEVELWDCSGDHRFDSCWPAIAKDANGVMLVFSPQQPNYDKELQSWYSYFVEQPGLREPQCLLLAHHKNPRDSREDPPLPQNMTQLPFVHSNLDEDGDTLRDVFMSYLGNLLTAISEGREQEELNIMNNR